MCYMKTGLKATGLKSQFLSNIEMKYDCQPEVGQYPNKA